jgi:tetratricopeptide (TPR) repeat protein
MGRKSRLRHGGATTAEPAQPVKGRNETKRRGSGEWVGIAFLAAITIAVFGQLATHTFLNYDDGQFIYENRAVLDGLSGRSIAWALSSMSIGWYPLTWLSHMLDVQLWALDAGRHLLTGMLIHIVSACLLFAALYRMTGGRMRSLMVAALFAIHPMHVESVAWASERKDTLSTFWAMLAILFYARWIRSRSGRERLLVFAALALSLASKQMLVTLPFILLLLDYWPLNRIGSPISMNAVRPLILEKLPLFLLSIAGCIVAVVGQRNLKALQSVEVITLSLRISNALVAYVRYLGKLFWPVDMAVLYPFVTIPAATAAGAAVLLLVISVLAIALRKKAPYVAVGWFWYLGALVPVVGLVQIGAQAIADRYTYFPYIGLFVAIVWGLAALAERYGIPEKLTASVAAGVLVALALVAWKQTGYWKNSDVLFTHTIAVTPPNALAEYSLGQTLQMNDPDRAIPHLRRSVSLADEALRQFPGAVHPDWYPQSHVALGTALLMKARAAKLPGDRLRFIDEGASELQQALTLDSTTPHAQANLEIARQMKEELRIALQKADPAGQQYDAALNKGTELSQQGQLKEAVAEFQRAVTIAPRSPEARIYLALGLLKMKDLPGGLRELQEAQKIDPVVANTYVTRALNLPPDSSNLKRLIDQVTGAR